MRRASIRRVPRGITTNTASVRENYTVSANDGVANFFSIALSNTTFNRAQAVAAAYQSYRVKYVKLTFRPSADTFPVGAGPIPQLYFQMNKYAAIPLNASLQTLLDMGARPMRFDDKNIVRAWKPTVLIGADQTAPASQLEASMVKTTPWLSTNQLAQNPTTSWTPSNVEHLGCVFFVTKPSNTTPTIAFNVDVEVVFQYRRPLAQVQDSEPTPNVFIQGDVTRPVQPSVTSG